MESGAGNEVGGVARECYFELVLLRRTDMIESCGEEAKLRA